MSRRICLLPECSRLAEDIRPPARILWYVNIDPRRPSTGNIRAAAQLLEINVDDPAELTSRYRRLGVLNRAQVTKFAKKGQAMALRFSHLELLDPVPLNRIRQEMSSGTLLSFFTARAGFLKRCLPGCMDWGGDLREGSWLFLSIRPIFWEMVRTGTKRVELRRKMPKLVPPYNVVLYATSPIRAVVGVGRVAGVAAADIGSLWITHGPHAGIERAAFDAYFTGLNVGNALVLTAVEVLNEPIPLDQLRDRLGWTSPPQSFRYIQEPETEHLLRRIDC